MAVRQKTEIMASLQAMLGDDTSDAALELVSDISDTLDSITKNSGVDWEQRYNENDAQWRKRYRDAFFGTPVEPDEPPQPPKKNLNFEDLFK